MDSAEFMKEEYLTLRKEVESAVDHLALMERYSIIASAAIYTWTLSQAKLIKFPEPIWFIPSILVLFCALRSFTIGSHLRRLSDYLKKIELEIAQFNKYATGWEHYHSSKTKNKYRTKITFSFWVVLLICTIIIGIAGTKIEPNNSIQPTAETSAD